MDLGWVTAGAPFKTKISSLKTEAELDNIFWGRRAKFPTLLTNTNYTTKYSFKFTIF